MEAIIATKRTRESGVEILKIIAIFLICISHAVQTAGDFIDYATPSLDIQMLALQVLSYTGMIGNTIFMTFIDCCCDFCSSLTAPIIF